MEEKSKASAQNLKVEVVFHNQPGETLPPTRVYLFDRTGKLVDSKPVSADAVSLPIDPKQNYRVYTGPDLLNNVKEPPSDLETRLVKAHSVVKDVVAQLKTASLRVPLSSAIYSCWFEICVVVHGSVRKLLNPGGPDPQYATICNGIVDIYEADLFCTLDRRPAIDIDWLRNRIIDKIRQWPPVPPIPPVEVPINIPPIGLGPFGPGLRPGPIEMRALSSRSGSSASMPANSQIQFASTLSEAAASLALLDTVSSKEFIFVNKNILWPILCEFIPNWWYCLTKVGEAVIQSDGSFSEEICFWCPDDFPDLYFQVRQNVGGGDHLIYNPSIACSTYYDYDGFQSVDITVTDPSAVACLEDPGRPFPGNDLYVWPTAIGNLDLRDITDLENNPAIKNPTTGLIQGVTPWGGTLALQMVFDPRLKTLSNVRYYRWSYQFDGDVGFTQIKNTVTHRYMTVTYSPLTIHLNPVTFGPKTVNGVTNLFDVPDPYPGDGWVDINDPYDRPFAYFDSTDNSLPPFNYTDALPRRTGLVTLLLEMFDVNGVLVPCSNLGGPGPFKFVLPDLGIPNQYTSVLTPNNITPLGQLTFRVRVDNNDTDAEINNVRTPIGSADSCGFLHFNALTDTVSIDYVARHPNNFLTWSLGVTRGSCGGVASTGGSSNSPVAAPPPPATFANLASFLLRAVGGSCNACNDGAAFAVNLYTAASASDGYGRQSQYDRSATIAFALIKP
jgi:hypothetical protein